MVPERRVDLKVIPGGRESAQGSPEDPSVKQPWWRGGFNPPDLVVAPKARGLRPVDVLLLVYLGVTACLMIAFQANMDAWGALTLGHVLLGVMILRVGAVGPPRNGFLRLVRTLYPLLAMLVFYWELSLLTKLSGVGPHDTFIVAIEERLMGFQPSQTLYSLWPNWFLSQYLHFAYFAYYLVPISLIFTLYFQRRWQALQESLTTLMLVFLTCCLLFIIYPVTGPYHYFGPPNVADLGGGIARLAHGVVRSGSSVGTAFPSSHTAVAVAVWISAMRLSRPVALLLTLIVPALALGTIYGGFHYVVDTIAGVLWGVACGLAGPPLHEFLARRLPRPGVGARQPVTKALPKSWGET